MSLQERHSFTELTDYYQVKLDKLKDRDIFDVDGDLELYSKFLEYLRDHPSREYYHVPLLKKILSTTSIDADITVVQFFTKLIEVHYCYYDGDQPIEVSRESYIRCVELNTPPIIEESGQKIEPFEMDHLGFYCIIKGTAQA